MEFIYPILAFLAGGTLIFLWQQKRRSDERSKQAILLNETEKLGLAKLAEAEKNKSLAEQQLSTLSRDFAEVKTDLTAERQKNEESIRLLTTSMAELEHAKKQLTDKAAELEQIQKRLTIEF